MSRTATAYVAVLVACAGVLTLLAARRWPIGEPHAAPVAIALLACMTGAWLAPIRLGAQTKFYLDTAVMVAAALLLSPALAMLVAGGGAALAHVLRREMRDGAQAAFNAAQAALVTGAAALALPTIGWRGAAQGLDRLPLALPVVAVATFALNAGLVAGVVALHSDRPRGPSFVRALRTEPSEGLAHLSLVAVGALAAILAQTHPWSAVLLAFPLAATYLAVRRESELRDAADRARVMSDAHLAEAQRLARLGNWWWDPTTGRVAWSEQVDRLFDHLADVAAPSYAGLLRMVDAADRARLHQALQDGWSRRAPVDLDLRVMAADGGERHLHLRGEPRSDPADGALRMIGTIQDVSERVAAEQAMRLAKERAEAAERTKHRLLAIASHDLRTPLTAIRGALDLLRNEPADASEDERSELLDIAQTNVERLTALVNDLLDLARIEAGRLELRLSPVDLRMIVAEVVEALAPQAAAKGLPMEVMAARDVPLLTGDPDRLYQVVLNLVGNAVKFTDAGRVAVTVRADGHWVELSVVDTGIGIAPDAAPHVFEEFLQEGDAARRAGGAGLGLSIVKRLVHLHGGTVRVESELGRGSVFTVRLPATPTRVASPVAEAFAMPAATPDVKRRWVDAR